MHIAKIENQSRRDFTAVYECEHCGHTKRSYGYDDDNFHRNVVPNMKCDKCDKTAGSDFRPMGTKYAADAVV